ncbi:MAG: prepilin-type N-terminal cleavage/methylation domain-containing protein [Gemmatimonadetes bacterium]|nr:prepilin-type N-terminal cleavage/methylation domain-containing protein [Gemmatimonadota bacterium]
MTPRPASRAGFTLIELIIAVAMSSIVLGAVYRILVNNQRFYRAQSQIVDVQQNVRAVAEILPAELRELDAADGDIIQMSDTALRIKAMRSFSVICAPPNVVSGEITVRNSLTYSYRSVDPARDNVLVFADGDVQSTADDQWLDAPASGVTTGVICTDGAAATRLTLTGANLANVTDGSPVRTYELVNYRLYDDGTGTWWVGVQSFSSGAWSATSPVAGPFRPNDGITFTYYDTTGTVTAVPADVAQIQLTVRGRSTQPIQVQGRSPGQYQDSLTVFVALRNN